MTEIQHDDRFDLDGGQREALVAASKTPEGRGENFAFACNQVRTDAIGVARVGEAGSRLEARVSISILEGGDESYVWLSASQARQFAAYMLAVADEVDGATPLVFTPPPAGYYVAEDARGDECVWRERPDHPFGDECVASYPEDLVDGQAWGDLFANLPRRAVVVESTPEEETE